MSIPKKPLAVSRAKKKLPVELDWGKGIPKDRLRYINAKEEALIKRFRTSKSARDYAGIPAYADDSASSKGVERSGTTTGTTTTKSSSGASKSTGQGGQGTGSKGPSGAGQGPNSSSSASKSPSSSSSGSKSPSSSSSSQSAATSGTSKAPNAAGQAAANAYKASQTPKTNAGASVSTSKAPNLAASYAAQKLNATSGALKAAQQPQSIQGMINTAPPSGTATPWGGADPRTKNTAYPSRGDTPGVKPSDKYNTPNWGSDIGAVMRREAADIGVPNAFVDNSAQKFHDYFVGTEANPGQLARFTGRTPAQISEMARTTYGEAANQGPLGMAAVSNVMENRLNYGKTYNNSFGRGDIDKMLSKFDANGYDYGVRKGVPQGGNPAYQNAIAGTEGMTGGLLGMGDALDRYSTFNMTAPDAVRNATHYYNPDDAAPKWGNGFTPYGDHVFGNPDPGPTANRVASLRDSGGLGSVGLAAAAPPRPSEPSAPMPQDIPSPSSLGIMGPPVRDPAAARMSGLQSPKAPPQGQPTVATDPRVSMAPGSYPAAPSSLPSVESLLPPPITRPQGPLQPQGPHRLSSQNMQTPPGWGQEKVLNVENYVDTTGIRDPAAATVGGLQAPKPAGLPSSLPGFNPPGLTPNFRGTAGVASTGMVPGWGYSPLGDGRATPGTTNLAASSPSTFSPQAAPGDAVPEDGPTYSDSPIQGPSNPMQEGPQVEDPKVKSDRQKKYASRGATIGSVIAGPLGAIIGGTLGWQMGKTTPGQRQAIANNPQALNANVQSINTMVEERGGKGNPSMRVTPQGFRDVLTNPQQVSANPQAYTTLEQMLAALAQGIDPETGKPIT